MKVYKCPIDFADPDYGSYDVAKERAREAAHREALKAWLIAKGWKGKHTGKTLRMPMADGYAEYMLADGAKSALIHLPYGDAWDSRDVAFLPKTEVLKRIAQDEKLAALFAKK